MSRLRTERLLLTADGLIDAAGRAWPDFAAWCTAHAGARAVLYAGPRQMHTLRVPDDLPLDDDEARLGYGRLQFTHYFGPAAQAWPLAAWPAGVCALVHGDLPGLQAAAARHRVKLAGLRPSWTLAPVRDGHVAVREGDLITWLLHENGRLADLQQRHADDEDTAGGAEVLDAAALLPTGSGQPGPDFIAPPARGRALAWAWAAAASAACALVAVQVLDQRQEAQRLADQAGVLARMAAPRPGATAPAAQRAKVWAAARQLDLDWAGRWTELEQALPPDVQLAALDMDGSSLRLEGQTQAADAVTQLVDRLALRAAAGEEVVLTRLQRPEAAAGADLLRFELIRRKAGGLR